MGLGFLQGFYEDEILGERSEEVVVRQASTKAKELAMLGMTDEAHAIISTLQEYGKRSRTTSVLDISLEFFYQAAGLPRPGATHSFSEEELKETQLEVLKDNTYHLPDDTNFSNVTNESYSRMSRFAETVAEQNYANTTTGYQAMLLSQALVGQLYMAHVLERKEDVGRLLKQMAQRIHANQQAEYFPMVYVAWEEYFLNGDLRRQLEISEDDLRAYADFVHRVARERLGMGPVHPDTLYKDRSVRELLEELQRNTQSDPEYNPEDFGEEPGTETQSILKEPATLEAINEAERKIGRPLPQELKEFLQISNGCEPVKDGPGFRKMRFVPVEEMFLEEDGYMGDYTFTLIPDVELDVEVDWPGITDGGIAMYEHDGQGTSCFSCRHCKTKSCEAPTTRGSFASLSSIRQRSV